MRLFSLLLVDTPIEDVFIYRTSLYCWTFEKQLRIYATADLEAAAATAAENPERSALLNYVLFHTQGLGAPPEQQAAWRNWMDSYEPDEVDDPPIVIDGEGIPYEEVSVQLEGDAVLDVLMYYNRLYLATDAGLYAVDPFEPEDLLVNSVSAQRKVRDACYSASAGLGTIAASCGSKGLSLVLDDFRASSRGGVIRKVSDESVRAEVGYGNVVNHPSRVDYEFLAATVENTERGRILLDTRKVETTRSQHVVQRLGSNGQNIDFTFWDRSRLVMFGDGIAMSVSVVTSDDQRRLNRVRNLGTYGNVIGRIVSAARVDRFFAIESGESVAFFSDKKVKSVETGRLVSFRTYPNSYRYQRLTTVTSDKGLWMFGLI